MGICFAKQTERQYIKTMANSDQLLNTYNVKSSNRLGKGSFGVVYKATNRKNTDQLIAVKQISKGKLSKEEVNGIHEEVKLI